MDFFRNGEKLLLCDIFWTSILVELRYEKKDKLKTLDNFARDVCGISGKLKEFNQELLVILVDRIEVHKGKLVLVWKDGKCEEKTL